MSETPEPQHPEYRRLMAVLDDQAAEAEAEKETAIAELSGVASDEEVLAEIGLDLGAIRRD